MDASVDRESVWVANAWAAHEASKPEWVKERSKTMGIATGTYGAPAMNTQRMTRITCECGYTEDVPTTDKLNREIEASRAYRNHQKECPVLRPVLEEARDLVLRLQQNLLPRLGWTSPIAAYGLEEVLGLVSSPETDDR